MQDVSEALEWRVRGEREREMGRGGNNIIKD